MMSFKLIIDLKTKQDKLLSLLLPVCCEYVVLILIPNEMREGDLPLACDLSSLLPEAYTKPQKFFCEKINDLKSDS